MPVGSRANSGGWSGVIKTVAAAREPKRTGVATESEWANLAPTSAIASYRQISCPPFSPESGLL